MRFSYLLKHIIPIGLICITLNGCAHSVYGVPQQEWVRLNEQEKRQIMDSYLAQQRADIARQQRVPTTNYYPVYPTVSETYYATPPTTVVVPVRPPHSHYAEQQRVREAERRLHETEHRLREARAREERLRHERNHSTTPHAHTPSHSHYTHFHSHTSKSSTSSNVGRSCSERDCKH